jgi:hypothetical protein
VCYNIFHEKELRIMKKIYSREELLTPELRKLAPKYRKKLKDWEKKYKPSEKDIRLAKSLIGTIEDSNIPEDASKNFRYYLYQAKAKE